MKSFLQGKKALSLPGLRPPPGLTPPPMMAAAAPRCATAPTGGGGAPRVEVVKEGDKVVRLVVVCGCGERTEIECLYPAGS